MRQFTATLFVLFFLGYTNIFPNSDLNLLGKEIFQEAPIVFIEWPLPGQALLGNIAISGSTETEGFLSAELFFGYTNDPTDTWFLIAQSDTPVQNDTLAEWDTTVITDGDYNIKLSVRLQNADQVDVIVQGLRVRNYSPIETDTPTPITPTSTRVPGDTPIPTITPTASVTPIPPTPTPLPTNPVMLTSKDIIAGFGGGILAVFALFLLLGGYLGIRRLLRNRN